MRARGKGTPTAFAAPGGRSAGGSSPSGFSLVKGYLTPAEHARTSSRPTFLNLVQATEDPCLACTGYCCRARVIINTCDLVRLAGPLGLPPWAFCDLVEASSRNGEPVLVGDTPRHIMLRRAEDEHCQFLMSVDGNRRCGVHALRPAICRIYPFSYERGQTLYELGYIMCPTKWVVSDERRDRVLDDIERHEQDRAVDRRIVREFNARPDAERTVAAFWAHALREAGEALGVDVEFYFRELPRARLKPALW